MSSDPARVPFLKAILLAPGDDLPRLVYADWLEENGTTDLDRATVEFVRLSCNSTGKPLMPRAAYKWLKQHWKRLVPQVVARNDQIAGRFGHKWNAVVQGRLVRTSIVVPYNTTARAVNAVAPLLRADQPLCRLPAQLLYVRPAGSPPVGPDPLLDLTLPEAA